ncbi:hypothetical protein Q0Z83_110050 [Actinoplanes sichuanensis]|uniref:Uncharacterized protein n=1 Tax=Actinoplanes sichuanensis TaxID=512349 RepID=A0ABW4A3F4_9ACTN|nr:hypothetical protein [Actinoplanes sichuanensis]BEL12814.1 hypothetical protein Q0Z83_110050 [Actinoplanes sichuanensis]
MAIYSQHPSRGRVQILATHHTASGLASSTVTSVNDTATATPIVDALNRVSACATIPMHTHDDRDGNFRRYPADHLDALADPETRNALLRGTHSFWYEYVKVLLNHALADLDDATADLPAPIRTAITTELHTEVVYLRAKPSKHSVAGADNQRIWDHSHPAVLIGGGMEELTDNYRERLDEAEQRFPRMLLHRGIEDLRLLAAAHHLHDSLFCRFEPEYLSISEDPDNSERYFVEVAAPHPDKRSSSGWTIELQRWIPDNDDYDENGGTATNEHILDCHLTKPPTPEQIVDFLKLCTNQPDILTTWAKTPTGELLAGTRFVVAERHDEVS